MLRLVLVLFTLTLGLPVGAEPTRYALDPDRSSVTIAVTFNEARIKVDLPIETSEIVLDFERLGASTLSMTMRADQARAPIPFVGTQIRSRPLLYTEQFPRIRFDSDALRHKDGVTTLEGQVEIRGKTRPLVLTARFLRPTRAKSGTGALIIVLEGALDRHDFGASGMPNAVGDTVAIQIEAHIRQSP